MARRTKCAEKAVDPELERQLANAPARKPVQAVFTLRDPGGKRRTAAAAAKAVQKAVDKVVEKAATASNAEPHHVSVFPNLGSFAVSGSVAFVRCILSDPDVASAIANVQREDVLIRPVKTKRPRKKK